MDKLKNYPNSKNTYNKIQFGQTHRLVHSKVLVVQYMSVQNKSGANKDNDNEKAFVETKEYVWHQNKNYVGGATWFALKTRINVLCQF